MTAPRYAAPRILADLPPDRPAVIEASAGTGKTYTLEHLVVDRLLRDPGLTIDGVLVVTFTEKATHEVRARIRGLLERLMRLEEDDAGVEDHDGPVWTIDTAARDTLRRALRDFDRAAIQTIHAFCQRVLTEHAFGFGRLFEQVLVDGRAAFLRVFRDLVRRRFATQDPWRPLLETWLARGKTLDQLGDFLTKAVEQRVAIVNAMDGDEWHEMMRTFDAWLVDDSEALEAEVLAARPGKMLEQLVRSVRRWRDAPSSAFAHALVLDKPSGAGIHKTALKQLAKLGSDVATRTDTLLTRIASARDHFEATVVASFLPLACTAFEEHKRTRGEVDYDDMLRVVADALHGEGGDELVALLRRRYRIALIDEFQDTDDVQWRIFRRIFEPAAGARLYTVGDPKQAIYGFRGADVYTYLRARDEIAAHGERVALRENYRSTPALIEALNVILNQAEVQPYFADAITYDEPVRAGRAEPTGDADGAPVRFFRGEPRHWPAAIAVEAGRLRRTGFVDDLTNVFVLAPTWKEATEVREAFRDAGVRAGVVRNDTRTDGEGVRDVRDVLAAVAEPFDRRRRLRAWATPFFAARLAKLTDWAELDVDHPAFARLLSWRALAERRRFAELFAQLLDESGYRRRALFEGEDDRAFGESVYAIDMLQDVAARSPASLGELVDRLGRWIDKTEMPIGQLGVQRLENARDAVQIMTLHSSKGLEADVVFLYASGRAGRPGEVRIFHDFDDDGVATRAGFVGPMPRGGPIKAEFERSQLDENRRLGYVAITRPARRLYVGLDPATAKGSRLEPLQIRLNALVGSGVVEERPHLFRFVEEADAEPARPVAIGAQLADWQAPAPAPGSALRVDFEGLARTARPIVVTSYSRMKRTTTSWDETFARDADARSSRAAAPGELVGGAESGSLLHDALERAPIDRTRGVAFDAWCADAVVSALFDELMRRYGRDPEQRTSAMQLVYRALTAPLRLGDVAVDGIATLDRIVRETPFLYPISDVDHPSLGAMPPDGGLAVEHGYLRGYIDVLFERDGRAFVVDWKSDVLVDYRDAALTEHVDRHYRLQREVYLAALVRMLGVRDSDDYHERIGGFAFAFLRGLDGDGRRGLHFTRPSWGDLVAFDASVRDDVGRVGEATR